MPKPASSRERILDFFLANVGRVIAIPDQEKVLEWLRGEVCRQEWCPLAVGVKYIIP